MKDVYVRAKRQVSYDVKAYLGMLAEYGGLGTAKRPVADRSARP
jgi:hypothetical protein